MGEQKDLLNNVWRKFELNLLVIDDIVDYQDIVISTALDGYRKIVADKWYLDKNHGAPASIRKIIANKTGILEKIEGGNNDQRFDGLIFKLGISQMIGFFENYLKELWATIIRLEPNRLHDEIKTTPSGLLSIQKGMRDAGDVVLDLYPRNSLSFQGRNGIEKAYLKLNIDLSDILNTPVGALDKLFAKRHAILHAGGIKDLRYLNLAQEPKSQLNEKIIIDKNALKEAIKIIDQIAKNIFEKVDRDLIEE